MMGIRKVLLVLNCAFDDAYANAISLCFQVRPRWRGWKCHMASPQDLMLQLFSLDRRRPSPEHGAENSAAGRELLDLFLTFDTNSDGSSDEANW